jgi:hypothetical protein
MVGRLANMEQLVEFEMAAETKSSEETCPGDIFYTTNPTRLTWDRTQTAA